MINPGTSEVVVVNTAVGSVRSQTLNPPTPVEVGRTVSGGVQDKAANGSELSAS